MRFSVVFVRFFFIERCFVIIFYIARRLLRPRRLSKGLNDQGDGWFLLSHHWEFFNHFYKDLNCRIRDFGCCVQSLYRRRLGTTKFLSSSFERFYTFVKEYKRFFNHLSPKMWKLSYSFIPFLYWEFQHGQIFIRTHIYFSHNRFRYSWELRKPRYTPVFRALSRVLCFPRVTW